MPRPLFFRHGISVKIPVSATSASNRFPPTGMLTALLPNIADLTFMFINNNPFDIRLEGTAKTETDQMQAFIPVTSDNGWLIMARSVMGPFTSKKPYYLSAQAFPSPGNPLPSGFDYSNCYLELVYGRGE